VGNDSKNTSSPTSIPTGTLTCKAAVELTYVHSDTKTAIKGGGNIKVLWGAVHVSNPNPIRTEYTLDEYGMSTYSYTYQVKPDENIDMVAYVFDPGDPKYKENISLLQASGDYQYLPHVTIRFTYKDFQKEAIQVDQYYLLVRKAEIAADY